ncbi:unnamed protein product [Phytomonas sp. EM1]|nr:unnamed protein product [Phytomonas sp. EM1]|eukprot:CCW63781.1 unnamed protein product [Phytomonas sp. isolate EM1]
MKIENTVVTDSEICFTRMMPPNSFISIMSTSGVMRYGRALFKFEGLYLSRNVVLLIEGTNVTWEGPNDKGGVVVEFTGSEISSIDGASGLFVLNTSAVNASSIFASNNIDVLTISGGSSVGIDWVSCSGCSKAAVVLPQISVSGSSMFRISHIKMDDNPGILASSGSISVSGASLYLVKDCELGSGNLFSFERFVVSEASLVSFVQIKAQGSLLATGSNSKAFTVDGDSHLYANIEMNGDELRVNNFEQQGFPVDKVVTRDDKFDNDKCAYSSCMPNHFTVPESSDGCRCVCNDGKYQLPACTVVVDSLRGYNTDVKPPCDVDNCWICTPSDRNKCKVCLSNDYILNDDKKCIYTPPPPPPPPTHEVKPTPPPILIPTNRSKTVDGPTWGKNSHCEIEKCQRCSPNGKICQNCEPGYEVSPNSNECVLSYQGASRVSGPLFIGVVSGLMTAVLL